MEPNRNIGTMGLHAGLLHHQLDILQRGNAGRDAA